MPTPVFAYWQSQITSWLRDFRNDPLYWRANGVTRARRSTEQTRCYWTISIEDLVRGHIFFSSLCTARACSSLRMICHRELRDRQYTGRLSFGRGLSVSSRIVRRFSRIYPAPRKVLKNAFCHALPFRTGTFPFRCCEESNVKMGLSSTRRVAYRPARILTGSR